MAPELDAADWRRAVFPAMGTTVTVLVPPAWSQTASVVEDVFAEWEARLSRFRPSSELSRLNRAGLRRHASRLLFDAVETAVAAAVATDGLFDPTLLDRLEALGYDRTFEALVEARPAAANGPDPADSPGSPHRRAAGGADAAWRRIRLDPRSRTIELPPGARIDLGGIAKGMAVDAAIALLRAIGLPAAAVEAGGDLAVFGAAPDGGAWRIEIEQPPVGFETIARAGDASGGIGPDRGRRSANGGAPPQGRLVLELDGGALATSSVGRRRWRVGDQWRHHLLDPRSGEPASTGVWSATAAAPTCTEAEVAAKVALLLGVDAGAAFLRTRGYGGLFIDDAGDVVFVGADDRPVPADRRTGAGGAAPGPAAVAGAAGTPEPAGGAA